MSAVSCFPATLTSEVPGSLFLMTFYSYGQALHLPFFSCQGNLWTHTVFQRC